MVVRNAKGIQFKDSKISVTSGAPVISDNAEVSGLLGQGKKDVSWNSAQASKP